LPVAAVVTLAALAMIWPVHVNGAAQPATWFPIAQWSGDFWTGAAILLFHLTGGGFLLTACLIAPEPVSTPLTGRGHLLFGVGLGVLTFAARVSGFALGAAYFALLAMNTLAPAIDRLTRRRIYGTAS
jgi:electron transport complex protein RnfD